SGNVELLRGAQTATTLFVIEYRGRNVLSIKQGFRAAARRAKLPAITPHTHFGTLLRLGWSSVAYSSRWSPSSLGTAKRWWSVSMDITPQNGCGWRRMRCLGKWTRKRDSDSP